MLLESVMPTISKKRSRGKPHSSWRKVCNSIFWILITGSRWCDLPNGKQWGARTTSHRWLGLWQKDGTLDKMLTVLLSMADLAGLLDWQRLAGDGFFAGGKGGGEEVEYGYKGKGVTNHLLVDGNGSPIGIIATSAKENEKKTGRAST